MALNKLGRVYSLNPGDASKLLPAEIVSKAREQERAVKSGKKAKKS